MSALSYGESPSQQGSGKVHPSKEVSQFKAPLRLQSGKMLAQDQRPSTQGSTSSKGVSQFKAPLRLQSGVQSGKMLAQDQPYSASGAPPFNGAQFFQVTNPLQPVVQQPEKRIEQRQYHAPSGMHPSNDTSQHARSTMSLPRVLALPSVMARDTYSAGDPITQQSSVFTDPYVGIPAPLSPLDALRQGQSSQFLRESDRFWQPALPQTEARVRSVALRRTKAHVTMKVILMGGTVLLVGGIASFLLLRFPTYLVVTWAILIIVFSNLVSRELRSYYQLTPTTPHMEAGHPSTISPSHGVDMGRPPVLKDISDTTGYLKALCIVFKPGDPTQTFLPETEYKV